MSSWAFRSMQARGACHSSLHMPTLSTTVHRANEDKFKILLRIVRLLLEDEDSVQAETYYNRAALLAPSTQDKEALLSFKLCQARISDYSRKFLEAAARYHELSWVTEIDEDDRAHMLCVPYNPSHLQS